MENGVVVGRFQTPDLTEGHKQILEWALENTSNPIVILGVPATRGTKNNPLDYESRKNMIEEAFPGKFQIFYLKDQNSDMEWSKSLEEMVKKPSSTLLIGTRDSLLSHYTGSLPVKIFEAEKISSENFQKKVRKDSQWRHGAFQVCQDRFPIVYPTVDCAIFDDRTFSKIWMAKKPKENFLRFVGGFADPMDCCFEESALREAEEETGMVCLIQDWIGSCKIDDWRYRKEKDKIITNLFALIRISGTPKASDDISELHLVSVEELSEENIQPEHRVLFQKVKAWVRSKKN